MAFSVLVAAACGSCGGTVLRKIITLLLATQVKRGKSPEERKRIEEHLRQQLLEDCGSVLPSPGLQTPDMFSSESSSRVARVTQSIRPGQTVTSALHLRIPVTLPTVSVKNPVTCLAPSLGLGRLSCAEAAESLRVCVCLSVSISNLTSIN